MADVTGKIYECFTEHLLRKIGWSATASPGTKRSFLYEKDMPARCHTSQSICAHADKCSAFSKVNKLPYGPWYDPDFFLINDSKPFGCIHVTHWSNESTSQRKFWRTMEDHLQYKTLFGADFLSISIVFVALEHGHAPKLLQDSDELIQLQGWRPATGAMFATSFDATLLFPIDFAPLQEFAARLPDPLPRMNALDRREFYNSQWNELVANEPSIRATVNHCVRLMKKAVEMSPHPRYTADSVAKLQSVCWKGRQLASGSRTTLSRYRKGIQHAFIVREVIRDFLGDKLEAENAFWRLMRHAPRFPLTEFSSILGLSSGIPKARLEKFRDILSTIPVQMKQRVSVPLLDPSAGINMVSWNADLAYFIQSIINLPNSSFAAFREHITELFESYLNAYGIPWVVRDLVDANRVKKKVAHVAERYFGLKDFSAFEAALADDMLSPYNKPPHQSLAEDDHNWPIDLLLVAYGLGSYEHLTDGLPRLFLRSVGHSVRPYAFMNVYGNLINHLMAGVPVGQYFSRECVLNEEEFYKVIWPLVAECIWAKIRKKRPLSREDIVCRYRHKKAQRIISNSDLEPISFLFRQSIPELQSGPKLRGAFNQLSSRRGWGRSSLTTDTAGFDPVSNAIIQTQSVFGQKHIADKTRELCARLRSVNLRLGVNATFTPEHEMKTHYLVVDGDWPIESKINLYEAGFDGIFEIGELSQLAQVLTDFPQKGRNHES